MEPNLGTKISSVRSTLKPPMTQSSDWIRSLIQSRCMNTPVSLKRNTNLAQGNQDPTSTFSQPKLRILTHFHVYTVEPRICTLGLDPTTRPVPHNTWKCRRRNSWQEGRCNVWRGPDCPCRNSWPERRRNASGTTIRRPRTHIRASVTKCRTRGQDAAPSVKNLIAAAATAG